MLINNTLIQDILLKLLFTNINDNINKVNKDINILI